MFLVVSTLLLCVILLLYYISTRNFNYWKKRNVVGPKPVPIFGNIQESVLRRKYMGDIFKEIYEQYPNEKVVGVYRMTEPCLLIRDLDIVKAIMIKDFNNFVDRGVEFSKEGLGVNLFHSDGETWKVLRGSFSPMFSSSKLKNMFHLLAANTDKHLKHFDENYENKQEVDISSFTRKHTIGAISATAFGFDMKVNDEKFEAVTKIHNLIFNATYAIELDMMFPGILKKLQTSLFPTAVKDFFYDLTRTVVKQRNGEPTTRNDFMDIMLDMRKQGTVYKTTMDNETLTLNLTEDILAAQSFVFFVAGYETSGTTSALMLYYLALNPDVQEKLIAEVDEELRKSGGEVTYDVVMNKMPYLNRVFDETLRISPIIDSLAVQRNTVRDYKVPTTNIVIPKGMVVAVSVAGIHHDEKYFPNPTKFDPDRFTTENSKDRHPCAYLAFGVGPRNCIGKRYGKLQVLVFMVKFFSKFRVEPCKKTPPQNELKYDAKMLVRNPEGGMYLTVKKR